MIKNKSKLIALLGMAMLMVTTQLLSGPYFSHTSKTFAVSDVEDNFTHYIGEEFGGGVIFHLWRDAQGVEHGLILDKTDLSEGQIWSNVNLKVTTDKRQSTWDGLSNSSAIVEQVGHLSSAAALCLNSTNGGQDDWYLPSIREFDILWTNYFTVARSLRKIAGATLLQSTYYWTSTENWNITAWAISFGDGVIAFFDYSKHLNKYVRAIRAF